MLCVFHNFPFPFSMSSLSLAGCLVLTDQSSNLPIWKMPLFHLSKLLLFFLLLIYYNFQRCSYSIPSCSYLMNVILVILLRILICLGLGGLSFHFSLNFLYFYYTYCFPFCFMFHLEVYQMSGNYCPSNFGIGHAICFAQWNVNEHHHPRRSFKCLWFVAVSSPKLLPSAIWENSMLHIAATHYRAWHQ